MTEKKESWPTIMADPATAPTSIRELVGEDRDGFSTREEARLEGDAHGEHYWAHLTYMDSDSRWIAETDLGQPENRVMLILDDAVGITARQVCDALWVATQSLL